MIGRVYRWRDAYWRVISRWRSPGVESTFVHPDGRVQVSTAKRMITFDLTVDGYGIIEWRRVRGCPRNVLLERVVPWLGVGWGDQWFQCIDGRWWRSDAATYRGERAERVVRPFRGLRRAVA